MAGGQDRDIIFVRDPEPGERMQHPDNIYEAEQDIVLIGGMTADIYKFQKTHPIPKMCSSCDGRITLLIKGAKHRIFEAFCQ